MQGPGIGITKRSLGRTREYGKGMVREEAAFYRGEISALDVGKLDIGGMSAQGGFRFVTHVEGKDT